MPAALLRQSSKIVAASVIARVPGWPTARGPTVTRSRVRGLAATLQCRRCAARHYLFTTIYLVIFCVSTPRGDGPRVATGGSCILPGGRGRVVQAALPGRVRG